MTKKKLIVAGMLIIGVVIGGFLLMSNGMKPDVDYIINYVKENQATKPVSLVVKRNGEEIISINGDQAMPLASTVKLVVAVEYAKQVDAGIIDPEEKVSLATLDKYYLENTDGGAHPMWIESLNKEGNLQNDEVTLREIAQGMIRFSSNANTDYLLFRLGIDRVNEVVQEMGMDSHSQVVPIAASLVIADYIQYETGLDKEQIKQRLREMTQEEYNNYVIKIHELMNRGELPESVLALSLVFEDMEFQKIWSDRLSAASAEDYIQLMERINRKTYFSQGTQEELDAVVGIDLVPAAKEFFAHAGTKGGSSSWILTNAFYATDVEGNSTEIVIMFNDLEKKDYEKIMASLDLFNVYMVKDAEFRNHAVEALN